MENLVNDFLNEWGKSNRDQKTNETLKTYQDVLVQFLTYVKNDGGDPNQLQEFDVQEYFNHLETKQIKKRGGLTGKVSDATIRKHHTIIATFLKHYKKEDYMRTIPYPEKRKDKGIAPKSLSATDVKKIKRVIERKNKKLNGEWKKGGKMQVALIHTLLDTGIRVFELVGLNLEENIEVSERKGKLKLIGKGGIYREVPLNKDARQKLMDYLSERRDENKALFVTNRGTRISVRNVQDIIKRLGESCDFEEPLHPHIFRHTWCYDAVKILPITTVAHLAGHADPKTTMIYTNPNIEEAGEALDNLYK